MTNTETNEKPAEKTPLDKLIASFGKSGRVVIMPDEDTEMFGELIATLAEKDAEGNVLLDAEGKPKNPGYTDWSIKAPETFIGGILAREKDGSQIRLIAFPDKLTALSDAVVQDWAYGKYVQAWAKAATDPDAYEAQFTVPSGPLAMTVDTDSFYFHVDEWIAVLEKRGLKGVKPRALKYALENNPFAQSKFPAFKDWDKLIDAMAKDAENHGHSTAYYAHCKATRDIQKHVTKMVTLAEDTLDSLLGEVSANVADNAPAAA